MTQPQALPKHVGIIMDGNGRWATARGLSRNRGHQKGAEVFGQIVRHAQKRGIPYLTVYAFSTENWNRPPEEVGGIMNLLRSYLRDADKYRKENVAVSVIGDKSRLDADLVEMIAKLEEGSRHNTGLHLNIGLSYGGRDELVHAARQIAAMAQAGSISPREVDHALVESCLYTAGQPDVDLIIRTGGEQRVSNFLLWQGAYAEFYFTPTLWPDFTPADFDAALEEYSRRERRMGGILP